MSSDKLPSLEDLLLKNAILFSDGPTPGTIQFFPNRDMQSRFKIPHTNIISGVNLASFIAKADVTITLAPTGDKKYYCTMVPGRFGINYAKQDLTSLSFASKNGPINLMREADKFKPAEAMTIHREYRGPAAQRSPVWIVSVKYEGGNPDTRVEIADPERIFSPNGRLAFYTLDKVLLALQPRNYERMSGLGEKLRAEFGLVMGDHLNARQISAGAMMGCLFDDIKEWGEENIQSARTELRDLVEANLPEAYDRAPLGKAIMDQLASLTLYEQAGLLMVLVGERGEIISPEMHEAIEQAISKPDLYPAPSLEDEAPSP